MGSWFGWQTDLRNAAGFPINQANLDFISAWHDHANADCPANPVDISQPEPNATRCKALPGGREAKGYVSHASAGRAFSAQINSGAFPHLVSVFNSGNSLTASDAPPVVTELIRWGSLNYAAALADSFGITLPGGAAGGPTHFHKGWDDLRRSVNHHYPNALTDQSKLTTAALRKLSHARKVL